MTDMVKDLRIATQNLEQGMRAHAFKKGAEAINLTEVFLKRNIRFDGVDDK